jgi:hypothetical protein
MFKKRIEQSILKFNSNLVSVKSDRRQKNQKPEKEVQKKIIPLLKTLGIFANVVESKAVFSASSGRYISGQASAGFPDIVGINPAGFFVAVELKAPGKRSSLKSHQREFLLQVIALNGFACCTDSPENFLQTYNSWLNSPSEMRKDLLISSLPKVPKSHDLGLNFSDD